MFHVMHRRLIAMKQCMLPMVERISGFMTGSDVVIRSGMRSGLNMMSFGGVVMPGGGGMMP